MDSKTIKIKLNKMEENDYIKERISIDSNYEGYTREDLLSVITELESINNILWESVKKSTYISDKDIDEIRIKMEKLN
tara:strand:- start:215 stop:448 length:234 start_codon:yes stop_codon:yes gene_type:complete